MIKLLLVIIFALMVFIVKTMIDIHSMVLQITKDRKLSGKPHDLEKRYQFIKGLY